MCIEIAIARASSLPAGVIGVLAGELSYHTRHHFPNNEGNATVRYVGINNPPVIGVTKEGKERVSEILQETRGSADDWFIDEQIMIRNDVYSSGRPGFFIHTIL